MWSSEVCSLCYKGEADWGQNCPQILGQILPGCDGAQAGPARAPVSSAVTLRGAVLHPCTVLRPPRRGWHPWNGCDAARWKEPQPESGLWLCSTLQDAEGTGGPRATLWVEVGQKGLWPVPF